MRAVQLVGHGGLNKLLYRTDVPRPEPAAGKVVVAVQACGVNNTDMNTRTGWYGASVMNAITPDVVAAGVGDHADLVTWDRNGLAFPREQRIHPTSVTPAAK